MYDAVRGEDREAVGFFADEGHHDEFGALVRTALGAAMIAVGERRLVAVVAVSDHQFLVVHRFRHALERPGIAGLPDRMPAAMLVGDALPR